MNEDTLRILKTAASAVGAHPLARVASDLAEAAYRERAEHEQEKAALQKRCDLAEELVAQVKPVIDKVVEEKEALEAELAAQKSAARVAKSEDATDRVHEDAIAGLTKALAAIVPDVEVLVAACSRIRDERNRSILQNREQLSHWSVKNANGVQVAVVERRSDAIQLVREMLALEKFGSAETGGEPLPEDRRPGRPTFGDCAPADRTEHAGESWPHRKPERKGGRLDGARLTKIRKRRGPHLT